MPSIANFSLSLDKLNDLGAFSEGDTVSGKVSLELTKRSRILSLCVKAKGDSDSKWKLMFSDTHSGYLRTFRRHERLFKEKEVVVSEDSKATLPPGTHDFPFSVAIPSEPLPSSFRGAHGSVAYSLEATLRRPAKKPRKVQHEISLHSKRVLMPSSVEKSQTRHHGIKAQLELSTDRKVYSPGDEIMVTAKILNSSVRDLEAIFLLKRVEEYRSRHHNKTEVNCLHTVFKDAVKSSSRRDEACVLQVPEDAGLTVEHCEVLSVHFYVQLSLDALPAFLEEEVPVVIVARDALPGSAKSRVPSSPGLTTA